MPTEKTCAYRFGSASEDVDEVCGQPADVVDRDDGTYLCRKHAGSVLDEQPERRVTQIDRTYDRLIAEEIFGYRICEKDSHDDCPASDSHLPVQDMPWFAERAEEAERVVERLRESGIDIRAGGVASHLQGHWRLVFADPETEPLAICVAALIAREVDF